MSAKAPSQQARRTTLSLTAGNKQHQQQQATRTATAGGANGNVSTNANSNKNDHKATNAKTEQPAVVAEVKEAVSKDVKKQQQQHPEKKQPQTVADNTKKAVEKVDENKSQNGLGKATGKQQNGSEENGNSNESANATVKDKQEKGAKEEKKDKEEPKNAPQTEKKPENEIEKKPEKESRSKRSDVESKQEKCAKDEKKDKEEPKNAPQTEKKPEKEIEKKPEKEIRSKRSDVESAAEKKKAEKAAEVVKMDISNNDEQAAASVPSKTATPTKAADKVTNVSPTKAAEKTNSPRNKSATVVTEDIEMQPLTAEDSPVKGQTSITAAANQLPVAASTPAAKTATNKRSAVAKSDIQLAMQNSSPLDRNSCPRSFSQISGRRSIRPLTDYAPSQFQNNLHFRESYRRINTELDVTSTTNTSLNVTVGSEAPNSSSFSFFGRGRKRDRTPPNSQSAMELQTDAEYSPPKRARLEGFLSVVASPLTLLRSRFSKTAIQSSTPVKLRSKLAADDEGEVQNVSGVSIEEETENGSAADEENTATEEVTVGNEMDDGTPKKATPIKGDEKCGLEKIEGDDIDVGNAADIEIADTPTVGMGIADTSVKNKRCRIM